MPRLGKFRRVLGEAKVQKLVGGIQAPLREILRAASRCLPDLGGLTRRNKVRLLEYVTNEARINSPQANKGPLPSPARSRLILPWILQAPAPSAAPGLSNSPAQHV